MKKPKVVPGLAKIFAGCFLVLVFFAAGGGLAEDKTTSKISPEKTSLKKESLKSSPKKKSETEAVKETASSGEKESTQTSEEPRDLPKFVGAETCISCHQDNGNNLLHSVHGRLMETRKGIPFEKSCETCHGPGSQHVEFADNTTTAGFHTIKFPPKLKASEANDICLTCHEAKAHFHWKGSPHDLKDVTCISCHSIHQDMKKPNAKLLKKPKIADVCFSCHLEKKGQFARNAHMPLNEGDMTCTSCHDMHGTSGVKNLKGDSVMETCFKCHADKRGPFLFEHPPARENCLTCHNPHGGHNDNLLVQRVPYLCQRCHTGGGHPTSSYDDIALLARSPKIIGKGCLNCHSNIHGSNHPSGKFFQR